MFDVYHSNEFMRGVEGLEMGKVGNSLIKMYNISAPITATKRLFQKNLDIKHMNICVLNDVDNL